MDELQVATLRNMYIYIYYYIRQGMTPARSWSRSRKIARFKTFVSNLNGFRDGHQIICIHIDILCISKAFAVGSLHAMIIIYTVFRRGGFRIEDSAFVRIYNMQMRRLYTRIIKVKNNRLPFFRAFIFRIAPGRK